MENVADIYPLSPSQEGMLYHALAAPRSGVYVEQYVCTIDGDLDPDAFKAAWEGAVNRHAVLRTAFLWEGLDEPLQVVREQVEVPWTAEDQRALADDEAEARLTAYLAADRARGFELAQAPLMRIVLIQRAADRYRFVWSFHHALLDGWSTALVLNEVWADYAARLQGQPFAPPERRPYRDHIAWLQAQDTSAARGFWTDYLDDAETPTPIPIDRSGRASEAPSPYDWQYHTCSSETTAALRAMAQSHRLTLNTVVQGAYALLLSRYSGRDDVIYGTTASGRPAALSGVEHMIGPFISTLPVRVQVPGSADLLPWLVDLQRAQVQMRQHEHTPLSAIQQWTDHAGRRALFDSLLVFENYPVDTSDLMAGTGLEVRDVEYLEQSNYPLAILVVPGERLQLIGVHDTGRIEAGAVNRLLGHIEHLLRQFADDPAGALSGFTVLTDDEHRQIVVAWNETAASDMAASDPSCMSVHQQFEAHAEASPDAVAVIASKKTYTYAGLNQAADALARQLVTAGVKRGDRVGLCIERGADLVVGILGIHKAGAAYVPLDPSYPDDRLRFMVDDAGLRALVTQQHLVGALPASDAAVLIVGEPPADTASNGSLPEVGADDLAYVIYTSGSTGLPKGVAVTHGNLAHSTAARTAYYGDAPDRFLLLSSFSFDSSVAGLCWPLSTGGALVVPPPEVEHHLHEVGALIEEHAVTHTLCLPALYALLLEQVSPDRLRSLRHVVVAGEACPASLGAQHYARLPHTRLHNEYGPTEATVWSTVYTIPPSFDAARVPVGQPIAGATAYVLDAYGHPLPVGVPGELYIGGAGVAQGYLNRPGLTHDRFVPDPFSNDPKARLYRTGDRARYRADGMLEFLGRMDDQVKIRGYRVEPGEIEALLNEHDGVQESVVVARAMHRTGRSSNGAFSAPTRNATTETSHLARQLAALDPQQAERLLANIEALPEGDAARLTEQANEA